jgi:hypothetical protein
MKAYNLYYSLIHFFKWKPFELANPYYLVLNFYQINKDGEIRTGFTDPYYLVLNFYQINKDDEIRTHDGLVIKALIPHQRTISTQKFMLLDKVSRYDLNYSLTHPLKWKLFGLETCTGSYYFILNFYQINKNNKI